MAHTGGGSVFGFSSSGGAAGGKPLFGGSAGGTAGTGDGDGGAGEGEGDGEGDNEVFGSGADAAPVVTLEEVPKVTGEEAEETMFSGERMGEGHGWVRVAAVVCLQGQPGDAVHSIVAAVSGCMALTSCVAPLARTLQRTACCLSSTRPPSHGMSAAAGRCASTATLPARRRAP